MANPNILNASSVVGKTTTANLTTTTHTLLLENTASSNKIFKINTLYVSNIHGANIADVSVILYASANIAGAQTEFAKDIPVPVDSSLVVIDKNTLVYLEEDKSIGVRASAANNLKVICSYEEIS